MEHAKGGSPDGSGPAVSDAIPEPFRSRLREQLAQVNWWVFSYHPRLHRVRRYVDAHPGNPIRLADAAAMASFERKRFCMYFRAKVGITWVGWVRLLRMHRAAQLFAEQDHSVSEVRRAIGIRDSRSFERTFKRILGVTPSEFKKTVWRHRG